MRVGVVVCGANAERGMLMERAVELYFKRYGDRVIQISACTVAPSPLILEMSGVKGEHSVAVNGCRNRCADLIMNRSGVDPRVSVVMDDVVERELGKCKSCTQFIFPDITEEEAAKMAEAIGQAIEEASKD